MNRRHGPSGYLALKSYLPWLRDEFTFRCVYCLKRETWGQITGEFALDHFIPQSLAPNRRLDYFNLVYACQRCNLVKHDQCVDDPLVALTPEHVVILPDGSLTTRQQDTARLIQQLDLNSPRLIRWRVMWLRIVELAEQHDTGLLEQILTFPPDLPNLHRLKPPSNSRPEGVSESYQIRRKLGTLDITY